MAASKKKRKKGTTRADPGFVAISKGKRPGQLQDDGSITFGKHILEMLSATFPQFRWIPTSASNGDRKNDYRSGQRLRDHSKELVGYLDETILAQRLMLASQTKDRVGKNGSLDS
jgi:hypothetical protein